MLDSQSIHMQEKDGKIALWLGAHAALAEDHGSVLASHASSQPSINAITENLTLFSDLYRYKTCMWCTYMQAKQSNNIKYRNKSIFLNEYMKDTKDMGFTKHKQGLAIHKDFI